MLVKTVETFQMYQVSCLALIPNNPSVFGYIGGLVHLTGRVPAKWSDKFFKPIMTFTMLKG